MESRIITFYSYKGGVGRSMALANVAILLASWGYKTLAVDWDLEAPGLENFYKSFINTSDVKDNQGLIELLKLKVNEPNITVNDIAWENYITTININGDSNLHLLTAGKQDESYNQNIRKFDYGTLYQDFNGGQYLEDLREFWLHNYDFVLIDSRTGLSASSGICSIQMPDILVLLFTPNEQSFEGSKSVGIRAMQAQQNLIYDRLKLRVVLIPSRIDHVEKALMDKWMRRISTDLDDLLLWLPRVDNNNGENLITINQLINNIKIPYAPFYSYGEGLPVIETGTNDPMSLGYAYETIAGVIANDLQDIHLLKDLRRVLIEKAKGRL